jgi:hypothetical protein
MCLLVVSLLDQGCSLALTCCRWTVSSVFNLPPVTIVDVPNKNPSTGAYEILRRRDGRRVVRLVRLRWRVMAEILLTCFGHQADRIDRVGAPRLEN